MQVIFTEEEQREIDGMVAKYALEEHPGLKVALELLSPDAREALEGRHNKVLREVAETAMIVLTHLDQLRGSYTDKAALRCYHAANDMLISVEALFMPADRRYWEVINSIWQGADNTLTDALAGRVSDMVVEMVDSRTVSLKQALLVSA